MLLDPFRLLLEFPQRAIRRLAACEAVLKLLQGVGRVGTCRRVRVQEELDDLYVDVIAVWSTNDRRGDLGHRTRVGD